MAGRCSIQFVSTSVVTVLPLHVTFCSSPLSLCECVFGHLGFQGNRSVDLLNQFPTHRSPLRLIASMDPAFAGKMNGLKIPTTFQKLLETKGITDEESFALLATDEKEVKTEILELARSSRAELKELSEQVAVKKLWLSCRRSLAGETAPAAASAPMLDEIPKEADTDLKSHWKAVHGFVLPESWLLSTSLQMKLWKAANATAPCIDSVLMENLRLLSQKTRATGTLVNVVPGRTVSAATFETDQIFGPMEVYSRSRAWFMTMAFVAIRKPTWFDLQTAVFASEKMFELVQVTSRGQTPPIDHFLEAWAVTASHFAEQMRISGSSLKSVVLNTGTWEHRWAWTASSNAGGSAVDPSRAIATDVATAREQARHWQSILDKQRHQASSSDQWSGGGRHRQPRSGRGKGEKGKSAKKEGKGGDRDRGRSRDHPDNGRHPPRVARERSRGRR